MHIPFVCMVKFNLLAQFLVDHLPPPSRVSSYTSFTAFAYHVINRFVAITILSTSAILLYQYFCFTPCEFFKQALTGDLPKSFDEEQMLLDLPDFAQYFSQF